MRRWMCSIFVCIGLLTVITPTASVHASGVNIGKHLGQHYMLFVIGPDTADADYVRQVALLTGREADLAAHDIVVGFLTDDAGGTFAGDSLSPQQASGMRNYFLVAPGKFVVALLGKDGTYEMMRVEPMTADALFAFIDGLPMR